MRLRHVVPTGMLFALCALPLSAESLSDPTRPPDYTSSSTAVAGAAARPSGPALQSTLISPQRRMAVVSGRQVKVGDKIDGAVVVDIQPYEVRLNRGGREISLRLAPKLVKE